MGWSTNKVNYRELLQGSNGKQENLDVFIAAEKRENYGQTHTTEIYNY